MTPPDLDRTSALFLDIDGTLLEIAARPEEVVVPRDLPALLERLQHQLSGALAIVSGRPLQDIDRLLNPFSSSAAGEHGAELRYPDGRIEQTPQDSSVPESWRDALQVASERWPGVRIEVKPRGITVHYRLARERRDDVWRLVRELVPDDHPRFRLLPAREAVEIGLRGASKGQAVKRLMEQGAFRGRRPIFVGDDLTDEAGISMALDMGGIGLRVGEVFGGDPAQVRAWLMRGADRLNGRAPGMTTKSGAR